MIVLNEKYELIILYKKYLNNKLVRDMNLLINNNSCLIAKIMTGHLTKYFSRLPKKISKNIPDNFYHLRHKTLICSNDEKMVEERIKMLRKIYEILLHSWLALKVFKT